MGEAISKARLSEQYYPGASDRANAYFAAVREQFPEELRSWLSVEQTTDFQTNSVRIRLSGVIHAMMLVEDRDIWLKGSEPLGETLGRDLRGWLKVELNRLLDALETMDD